MKRQITALQFPDASPAELVGSLPTLELVDPKDLYVDDVYQRRLSDRSVRLIRRIVENWSWAAFKPPIVVMVNGCREVIDGQHTAIAAVTHGGIALIPILLVDGAKQVDRAMSFVRHNKDRISVTPTQLHTAMVAAGDDTALTIAQVCARSGVTILHNPPPNGFYNPGDTVALATIRALINKRYPVGARKVLDLCITAQLAPISADVIKAVDHLMFAPEYKGEIDPAKIPNIINALGDGLRIETERFAAERKVSRWRAMASVIFMNRKKARGGGNS